MTGGSNGRIVQRLGRKAAGGGVIVGNMVEVQVAAIAKTYIREGDAALCSGKTQQIYSDFRE
ncbi:MAG: hypothetical protein FWG81_11080 [Betaproteobacteria bacterium]|nr:hypothetical protein [Betaproteobacteria bacterium]